MLRWITPVHSPSYRPGARVAGTHLRWKPHPNSSDEVAQTAAGKSVPISTATGSLPRLLIAEDERIVALDLMLTLRQVGCTVVGHALAGDDAVSDFAAGRTQILSFQPLIDLALPSYTIET